jgi:hypothetical protein
MFHRREILRGEGGGMFGDAVAGPLLIKIIRKIHE